MRTFPIYSYVKLGESTGVVAMAKAYLWYDKGQYCMDFEVLGVKWRLKTKSLPRLFLKIWINHRITTVVYCGGQGSPDRLKADWINFEDSKGKPSFCNEAGFVIKRGSNVIPAKFRSCILAKTYYFYQNDWKEYRYE